MRRWRLKECWVAEAGVFTTVNPWVTECHHKGIGVEALPECGPPPGRADRRNRPMSQNRSTSPETR
jgi:hypothetical protein